MKKRVFTNKLVFSKERIATLNGNEMNSVLAGNKTEIGDTCLTNAACCPSGNSDETEACA